MSFTSTIIILDADGWRVTSYGHGAAYLVECLADGSSLFMQDENASTFRDCWQEYEEANPEGAFEDFFYLHGYDGALEPAL